MSNKDVLLKKLEAFISKYYYNLLIRGGLTFLGTALLFLLLLSTLEHLGQFSSLVRTFFFWGFVVVNLLVFVKWILVPLRGLYRLGNSLTHQEAAKLIGTHFQNVEDKLLNLLQLQELSQADNELIEASIAQKSSELKSVPFLQAINLLENKKRLPYLLIPLGIIALIFLSGNKEMVTESSARILSFEQEFEPQAPFQFIIENPELSCAKGDDFLLQLRTSGNSLPADVYYVVEGNRYKMKKEGGSFSFLIKNPQERFSFRFWASGFHSQSYTLNVIPKPSILHFEVSVDYPSYTGKKDETLENVGHLEIPEGSSLRWLVNTTHTEQFFFQLDGSAPRALKGSSQFVYESTFKKSCSYLLQAQKDSLCDSIRYQIKVIPDAFPRIAIAENVDSNNTLMRYFKGDIQDDYGFSQLLFHYRAHEDSSWTQKEIQLNSSLAQQSFYHHLDLSSFSLQPDAPFAYFFEVWDNDQVNGPKSKQSSVFQYQLPSEDELEENNKENNEALKEKLEKSISLAEEIQEDSEALKRELLSEKKLGWEQQEKAKQLQQKQATLKKQVQELQETLKQNQEEKNRFQKPSEELLKKQAQLQKLFENIMTEEMKEMMKELEKMMDKVNKDDLQKMLEEMQQSDEDLEKELDRSLEIFKKMELEEKLNKNIDKLKELSQQQEELAKQAEEKSTSAEELKQQQEELKEEFEKVQKDLEETKKLNESLEDKEDLPDTKEQEQAIQEEMKKSMESLQKKQRNKASKSQKNSAQKLQEMSQSLQSSMQQSEQEDTAEDLETLRQILENLIYLSFEQEELLEQITQTAASSPLYVQHMQLQKKLQDDSQIIEDSLFALSKRQPQVDAIINKEINTINYRMEKSLEEMSERRSQKAREHQQFVMTAANNLALLLSETLKQLQQDLSKPEDKPSNSKKMCNKPRNGGGSPKQMKAMQQQLKKQMEKMLKEQNGPGNKGKGKKMSKELAKMAAQQEMIRQQMQELRKELSGDQQAKENIDQLLQQMEETEHDLINKNLTQETLLRQEQIMSKLLEAEKAHREREQEERRESQEWLNKLSDKLSSPYEEYQEEKKKQEELLRTIPPNLSPFFKKKVNEYFQNDGQ
jgi:hypothetical protein